MLGEKGLEVAKMWEKQGVQRVHFSWGPDAAEMTGEERAEFILSMEALPTEEIHYVDTVASIDR